MVENITGLYFDGSSSRAREATLCRVGARLEVSHAEGSADYDANSARTCPAPGAGVFTVDFPDGAVFEGADPLHNLERGPMKSLEGSWKLFTGALVAVGIGLAAFVTWGLPAFVRAWAPSIPASASISASEDILSMFKRQGEIKEVKTFEIPVSVQAAMDEHPELNIRVFICCEESKQPNAFALPNGHILLARSLVDELSADELEAVLLHEVGHVKHLHGQQAMLQNGLLAGIVMLTAGYGESFGWGLTLLGYSFSREHEKEADLFAAEALKKVGKSPVLLAEALERIEASGPKGRNASLLSTHPLTQERKIYLREAAP